MPTTSSNNTNKNGLSPDVYDIANYVNEVKKEFTPDVDEDTLLLETFGYFGSIQSDQLQNSIIMASEYANESIPTRAKFDKNIIAHALSLNIESLNAIPAKMEVLLTFLEDEIINAIGGGSGDFIFDCDNKIYFNEFEFHPDYDIIIRRVRLNNGSYTYTAMYDMTDSDVYENPISDITNPYLTPPVVMEVNGTRYLFTSCIIRQVEKTTIYKKILSDNTISSKTVNFDFESQLAGFTVDVTNSTESTHLVPVYEGLSSDSQYPYIWYTYLDTATIRLKFDRNSYSPRINSDVAINLQTTQGEAGNFTWVADYPQFSFDSDRLGYSNITVEVRPLTGESAYGVDKKSIEDLKRIIPKEALSRGSITNTKDLENFFNAIDTDNSQMYLYKKRSNNREFLYYTYIVMKDALANVIPTNTVNLMLRPDQLFTDANGSRLVLKKGSILRLDSDGSTAFISRFEEGDEALDYTDAFYYIIPYNLAICLDPMYGMYFLTTMDETRSLSFSYINEECMFQYIATSVNWTRKYLTEDDKYIMTVSIEQNISDDDTMVTVDDEGNVTATNVRCFAVFYSDEEVPYRYIEGTISSYNNEAKIITFSFEMTSEDYIDGLTPTGGLSELIDYGYMQANCPTMIHIVTKQPDYSTSLRYRDLYNDEANLADIISGLDEYCISNSYTVNNGINFFYNYSDIIYSTVSVEEGEYIPPDEPDPEPEEPPKDYDVGGGELDPNPDEYTLATEAAVQDAIKKATEEALGQVPRFQTDEFGTLIITQNQDEIITVSDDDDQVKLPDEEETEDPDTGETEPGTEEGSDDTSSTDNNEDTSTTAEPDTTEDQNDQVSTQSNEVSEETIDGNYEIGGSELENPADSNTIATEAAVANAVKDFKNNIIGSAAKMEYNEEDGSAIIYDNEKSAIIGSDPVPTSTDDSESTGGTTGGGITVDDDVTTGEDTSNPGESTGDSSTGDNTGGSNDDQTTTEEPIAYHFIIENVPVIKYGYFQNEDMVQYFASELIRRKNYIDEALTQIEDLFGINFKFVNTYGPSKLFTLDNVSNYINRVNLSLTFRVGLQVNYDENVIQYIKDDIKAYMEDINSIDSIHMSNLVTEITNNYSKSIRFFEFIDMNGYGTSEQHLYAMPMPDDVVTPELVNINTLADLTPDINIIIA